MTMTQPDKLDKKEPGASFDMYRFFSRKDVILAAVLILALLIYLAFRLMSSPGAV